MKKNNTNLHSTCQNHWQKALRCQSAKYLHKYPPIPHHAVPTHTHTHHIPTNKSIPIILLLVIFLCVAA